MSLLSPLQSSSGDISNCSHLLTSVGFMSGPDFRKHIAVAKCDICEAGPKGLWLCLYPDCFMLGCSEGKDHSTVHNHKNEKHCVQLNIDSRRLWCYKCSAEVEILSDVSRKFGALLPAPKDGVQTALPGRSSSQGAITPSGLVGLANLGNTCYMNAALQCLLNIPALTDFFLSCPALVLKADKNAMSKAFKKLVEDVWRRQQQQTAGDKTFVSPSGVLYALKTAYPMFRGFQQHDSQEFLRCIMDLLHDELMEPALAPACEDDNLDSISEVGSAGGGSPVGSDAEPEEYVTADSGVSEQSSTCSSNSSPGTKGGRKRKMLVITSQDGKKRERDNCTAASTAAIVASELYSLGSGDTGFFLLGSAMVNSHPSDAELDFVDATSDVGSPPLSSSPVLSSSPRALTTPSSRHQLQARSSVGTLIHKHRRPVVSRSLISDIFDGKLVSSVQCLTCDRVSMTSEIFQDLSLPIPTQDTLTTVRNQPVGGGGGWISWVYSWLSGWFYGPNITLIDCLSYFFSADELKGDNMYSCERCKKLRNGLKYSRVTVLPDSLCIHLKRFRHEFAFSSKISTKVTFPLVDLDMSPWLHKDSYSDVSLFDLTGVICHHGGAGGGHYTAYALNPVSQEWYEFDDSIVTKVDPAAVLNAEAYVLFYRKNNIQNEPMRMEMQTLLRRDIESPGLIKFFVSLQWLSKFDNFAEPGPVDNSDFLCPHGGVLPLKSFYVYDLCVAVPQSVWDLLHQRFGGGPACTRLYECAHCRQELDALNKQKKFELEEFKALHGEFQEQENPTAIYCLSSSWFKQWENFVTNRQRDPPGLIDNKAIITSVPAAQASSGGSASSSASSPNQQQTLRTSSDYLQVSQEVWQLFHTIYGGGPEVVIRPNGTIYVSPQSATATFNRPTAVRLWSRPGVITRAKAKSISEDVSASSPPFSSVDLLQMHVSASAVSEALRKEEDKRSKDAREEDPEV